MNSKKKHSKDESSSTNATSSPPSSHLSSTIFNSENTFLFASNIQIVYKCETVQTSHSAMLNYNTTKDTDNNMNNFEEEEDDDDNKRKIIKDKTIKQTSPIYVSAKAVNAIVPMVEAKLKEKNT